MLAIRYDAIGAPPRPVEIAAPDCPPDGVVVDVRATGVCRSDWHAWRGHDPVALPHVGGHEFAGVVARVGADVTGVAVGDRVTAPFVHGCGRCGYCRAGDAQVCPDQTQPGFTHPGSFAEQVVVRAAATNLVRLPDDIGFAEAASLGCRFATAWRAVTAHARISAGEPVVVIGCGGVGLSAVMIAVALGARVIAVDPSSAARAAASELGAEHTVDAATDPLTELRELTDGGARAAIDAIGAAATAALGVRSLRPRGRHVQVGLMVADDARAPLPWDEVIARELTVHGSHGMSAADYPAMLTAIAAGTVEPDRLVAARIGLTDIPGALAAMDEPTAARAGLVVAEV